MFIWLGTYSLSLSPLHQRSGTTGAAPRLSEFQLSFHNSQSMKTTNCVKKTRQRKSRTNWGREEA